MVTSTYRPVERWPVAPSAADAPASRTEQALQETTPSKSVRQDTGGTVWAHMPPSHVVASENRYPTTALPPFVSTARFRMLPSVVITPAARPLTTGYAQSLTDSILAIIGNTLDGAAVPCKNIVVDTLHHREERWQELVFRVHVNANASQALALWDAVGDAITRWRVRLDATRRRTLDEQIAIYVEW